MLTFTRRHNEAATTFANRTKTHAPGKLLVLLKYGDYYLDETEFEKALGKLTRRYSRSLLKGALGLRLINDQEYREYHRAIIRQLSKEIERKANGHQGLTFAAARTVLSGLAKDRVADEGSVSRRGDESPLTGTRGVHRLGRRRRILAAAGHEVVGLDTFFYDGCDLWDDGAGSPVRRLDVGTSPRRTWTASTPSSISPRSRTTRSATSTPA